MRSLRRRRTMGRLRDALAIALAAAAIILLAAGAPHAQDQTPEPRMLLNLDLFTAQSDKPDASGGSDSMFERIRALRAMGYLDGNPQAAPAATPAGGGGDIRPSQDRATPSNTLDLGVQK